MQNVPGRLSKDSRPFLKCECSFFKIVKVDIKKQEPPGKILCGPCYIYTLMIQET